MRPLYSLLRHKVILEQRQTTGDGMGGTTNIWQEVATLWAEISNLRASEASAYGQVYATGTKKFRVRYLKNITEQMRILHDGRTYNIRSIRDMEGKKRVLEIIAEEGAGS